MKAGVLKKCDGMFVMHFIIKTKELILARDTNGTKHYTMVI